MVQPSEHRKAYANEMQRAVLMALAESAEIGESFFLTGGTALSVFYLGHRISIDIDLFTVDPIDLSPIDLWIRRQFAGEVSKMQQSSSFLSYVVKGVKIDIAVDLPSNKGARPRYRFEEGRAIMVDTIENIASNKLCTLISRTEPKDYIDYYCVIQAESSLGHDLIYEQARAKDGLFDDPPAAAYLIEQGYAAIIKQQERWPNLLVAVSQDAMQSFYRSFVQWIYEKSRAQ